MSKQIFIVLILSLANIVVAAAQQPAIETPKPLPASDFEMQNGSLDAIYIPSPFAEGSDLTAVPGMEPAPSHPIDLGMGLAFGQQQTRLTSAPAGAISDLDDSCRTKIKIESLLLTVDAEVSNQLFELIDTSGFEHTGGEVKSDWNPSNDAATVGVDFIQSSDSVVTGHPTMFGKITAAEFAGVLQLVKRSTQLNLTQAPATITYENQTACVFDGSAQQFVVAVRPYLDENDKWKNVPVIQTIEQGVIARYRATQTETGIRLNSHFIANSIPEINTFTFNGSSTGNDPSTVQIPVCHCTQLRCSKEIENGSLILIDANIVREKPQPARLGFINRLFNSADPAPCSTRTMFILKATIVE